MATNRKAKMLVAPQKKQTCMIKTFGKENNLCQKSYKKSKFCFFISNYNGNFKAFSSDGKLKRVLNPTPIIAENQNPYHKDKVHSLQTFRVDDDKVF